jgi:signal transduction histidine kinase
MQKRADDPREVASLARRQERELRDWLAGDGRRATDDRFAAALRRAAEEIEDVHRAAIDVVVVGDCPLDERSEALLGAVREALVNAAKHAGDAGAVRVYAEVDENQIELFVRDRGPGFDLARVPPDRQGVRESIIGRMERAGGSAEIRSVADGGTEVGLTVPRMAAEREGGPA